MKKIIKSQILDTGTTLSEIAFLLDEHEDTLLLLHGDGLEWIRNDYKYREYSYRKKGITIGCYSEDYSEYLSKYIELDRDKISFLGITASSDFEDVMNVLGETDVYEIQDGLPELVTYELRYQFDWYSYNYTLRIYSNSKDGSDGVYMSLVAVNDPKYRVIRITTEKISRYFDMTKEELVCKLGEDNDNFYYKQYNAFFTFDEQGKKLIKLGLSGNYQINDIREGFSMDKVMEVMGKRKIYTDQTSEDGPIYYIEYKYDNFILLVEHFFAEGWGTTWTIKSTEYDGLW